MIVLKNINKLYTGFGEEVHALKDTNLSISKGENVVIVGKSGSGKSTLLNVISGIDRPSLGNVVVNGQDLNGLDENELAIWRGENIGIVFQYDRFAKTGT